MTRPLRLGLAAVVLMAAASGAVAHHATTMYDKQVERQLEGTVKEFEWVNPHIRIQLLVNENGKAAPYAIEAGSPNGMTGRGWKSTTLKPGDKVTFTVNPLRTGEPNGLFVRVVLPDGNVLSRRDPQPYAR